jgi:hypothetical protein
MTEYRKKELRSQQAINTPSANIHCRESDCGHTIGSERNMEIGNARMRPATVPNLKPLPE